MEKTAHPEFVPDVPATTDSADGDEHKGGFRPMMDIDVTRGGPRFGEYVESVRLFMDRTKAANPSPELVAEVIETLAVLNEKLAAQEISEWSAPMGTRLDLPARGNITLPPFTVTGFTPEDGLRATARFTRYHLGGNNAAHGGQVAVLLDDLFGMTAALAVNKITRTGYLTVNYRAITPLNTDLDIHTQVEKIEGRKVYVRATVKDGDRLCVEADGLFISLNPGQP